MNPEPQRIYGKTIFMPEYKSWQMMKNRCLNPRAKDYPKYGGRGIMVCDRWKDSFANFLADMGCRPEPDMTLDRIDGDGNYEPGNCRWATRLEQSRNRAYAKTKGWVAAERLGVKPMTAHHMIWQVRAKDKGTIKRFTLSPETEQKVRAYMQEAGL